MCIEIMRIHTGIPEGLLNEVNTLVGPGGRNDFFVAAARKSTGRHPLRNAAHELVGSLRDANIPGWETPESVLRWMRSLRA